MVRSQIYNYLYEQISRQELKPGDRLPTEKELAKKFKTNLSNAHLAMKALEKQELIERHRRIGSFVKNSVARNKPSKKYLGDQVHPLIHVVASSKPVSIHWNEHSLLILEKTLNDNGFKVTFHKYPDSREDLSLIMGSSRQEAIVPGWIVFMHNTQPEKNILLENCDLLMNYPGEIFEISCGRHSESRIPCHVITTDPFAEGMLAAEYLVSKSCSSAAFCYSKRILESPEFSSNWWLSQRLDGIKLLLSHHDINLELLPEWCDTNNMSDLIPEQTLKYVLKNKKQAVLIAMTDGMAARIIDHLNEKNLLPGIDYSIISFDNDPAFREYNLTTISPRPLMPGEILSDIIIKNKVENKGIKQSLRITPEIIERTSVIA